MILTLDKDGFIDTLEPHEVFVFGSNTAGRHGKGGALTALRKFGAVYGVGEGLCGQSYAFPTLDHLFRKVKYSDLKNSRDKLYQCCHDNPDKTFFMTKIGCGLAGFSEGDVRSLFVGSLGSDGLPTMPRNLVLPEDWR